MLPRMALTIVVLVGATLVLVPPIIATSLFPRSAAPVFEMMRLWALLVRQAMGFTCSIEGIEKVVPGRSYVLTPNHQGYAESLALAILLPVRFRWVMKKELLKIPLFGWALGRTGGISLDRSKGGDAISRLRSSKSKLADGWSVLCYPEGTRTKDGRLQPFKKGAFIMAIAAGVPILPIAVNGAFDVLPRDTLALRRGHVTITICDPIDTVGMTEQDVPMLIESTRQAVLERMHTG
jgi:1-acyl-sn-glycerol-3-phosphate acyltransferase